MRGVLLLILLGISLTATAIEEFRILTLRHRLAQELLPLIEPMVGPEGSVRAIDNLLLVTTGPARFSQIEAVVDRLDVARQNLKITVSHSSDSETRQREMRGTVRAGDANTIRFPPGAAPGVRVELRDGTARQQAAGSEFLTVMEGARAFIQVGQLVPYTQQWVALVGRHARVQQSVAFQQVTTGFAVRPRVVGGLVELEIAPEIASRDQGGAIVFETLSTVVQLTPGEWFDLGGHMQQRDEVSREILAYRRSADSQQSSLRIKVETDAGRE